MVLAPVDIKAKTATPAEVADANKEARPAAEQTAKPQVSANAGPALGRDKHVRDTVERVMPMTDAAGRLVGVRFRGPQPPAPGQYAGGTAGVVNGGNTAQPSPVATNAITPTTAGDTGAAAAIDASPSTNAALVGINATGVAEYLATPMAPNAEQMRAAGLSNAELSVPNNRQAAIEVLTASNMEMTRQILANHPELARVLEKSYRRTHNDSLDGYQHFSDEFAKAMAVMTVTHNHIPEDGKGNVRIALENGLAMTVGARELAGELTRHGASSDDIGWMQGVFATLLNDKSKPMPERLAALATIEKHAQVLGLGQDLNDGNIPANIEDPKQYNQAMQARIQRIEDGYRRAGIPITGRANDANMPSFQDYRPIRDEAIVAAIQGRANVAFSDSRGRLFSPTPQQLRRFPITTASARNSLAAHDRARGNTASDVVRENGIATDGARATQREQARIRQELARAVHAGDVRTAAEVLVADDRKKVVAEEQIGANKTSSALNLGPDSLTPGVAENRFGRA